MRQPRAPGPSSLAPAASMDSPRCEAMGVEMLVLGAGPEKVGRHCIHRCARPHVQDLGLVGVLKGWASLQVAQAPLCPSWLHCS